MTDSSEWPINSEKKLIQIKVGIPRAERGLLGFFSKKSITKIVNGIFVKELSNWNKIVNVMVTQSWTLYWYDDPTKEKCPEIIDGEKVVFSLPDGRVIHWKNVSTTISKPITYEVYVLVDKNWEIQSYPFDDKEFNEQVVVEKTKDRIYKIV